jgi:undecaprenyl-phosphate glucose phosphotransferase
MRIIGYLLFHPQIGDRVFELLRVTPSGRILPPTSQDQLTQLPNVLEGKMSIVGPLPHAVTHNEQYHKLTSGYMIRSRVRPGITGHAQINGLCGEIDTIGKMNERIRVGLEYPNGWPPWLEVKIVLKTIWISFFVRR